MEDVTQRIRLSLNYLDNNPDEEQGWMPFFGSAVTGPTPCRSHCEWDACDAGWRMIDAYILARQVLGQAQPGEAEQKLRAFVLGTIRADGLSYRPDRPWCKPHAWMWDHGRAVIALATWLRFEPTDEIAQIARRMMDGLGRIALKEKDYWYFPAENWLGNGWGDTVYAHPPTGLAIEGLVDLASLLKEERYLDMAGCFVRAVRTRKPPLFTEDGTLIRLGGGPYKFQFTHLHSRLGILLGLLKYALAIDDPALRDWCTRSYVFVRNEICSSFGWVPESLEVATDEGISNLGPGKRRDEVCGIADMMQIAAVLAENGMSDEGATIGRYGTNSLFAHQLMDFTPLRKYINDNTGLADTLQFSYRGMPDRCLGGFQPEMYPNELMLDIRPNVPQEFSLEASGCCSPAGIKSLYVLWNQAVRRKGETLHICLWATMEHPEVNLTCDEPTTGRLHLRMKRPCADLEVNVPEYVTMPAVSVDQSCAVQGHTLHLGTRHEGDAITITYPLVERKNVERIADSEYQITWKGGRVIDVAPPAVGCDPYWWRKKTA
jgi:hypothetical protein